MTKQFWTRIFHPKCFGPEFFWTYIFLVDLKIPNTKPITKEPSLVWYWFYIRKAPVRLVVKQRLKNF